MFSGQEKVAVQKRYTTTNTTQEFVVTENFDGGLIIDKLWTV